MDAEGVDCWTGYNAMRNYDLFQPQKSKLAVPNAFPEYFDFKNMNLPEATRACEHEAVWLDEAIFRAGLKGECDRGDQEDPAECGRIKSGCGRVEKEVREINKQINKKCL